MRDLQVTLRRREGMVVIDLRGEIATSAEERLLRAYRDATHGDVRAVVLSFEQVDYINSTGIALIVRLLAQARTQEVRVGAYGLSDHYREIFEITRLADFMTIADTEDGAVDGVREQR